MVESKESRYIIAAGYTQKEAVEACAVEFENRSPSMLKMAAAKHYLDMVPVLDLPYPTGKIKMRIVWQKATGCGMMRSGQECKRAHGRIMIGAGCYLRDYADN